VVSMVLAQNACHFSGVHTRNSFLSARHHPGSFLIMGFFAVGVSRYLSLSPSRAHILIMFTQFLEIPTGTSTTTSTTQYGAPTGSGYQHFAVLHG
jgi:hypothetical protein